MNLSIKETVLVIVVSIAIFFIGFECGSAYEEARGQALGNGTVNTTAPAATYYNGTLICTTTSDCPANESCLRPGPLLAGQQTPKVCVPNNQAVPL